MMPPDPQRWEYDVVTAKKVTTEELNARGLRGWELMSAIALADRPPPGSADPAGTTTRVVLIFKRPR